MQTTGGLKWSGGPRMTRILALGPEAGNLLGYLASLGALVVLERALGSEAVRMCWEYREGGWRPVWDVDGVADEGGLVEVVHRQLQTDGEPPGRDVLGEDLSVPPATFRAFALRAARSAAPWNRRESDFALAFGCEATQERGKIQDTALRTMSGAGHQHFLGSMAELARLCKREDIEAALFRHWEYRDDRPSMRWDPVDDRRYAYRADDPAKSRAHPIRTVRGANRLAIEAMPVFPTAPRGGRLATAGFIRIERTQAGERGRWLIRWPVWDAPITAPVVRSLMTLPDIMAESVDVVRLGRIGIVEVYQAERLTEKQFRNFTPARALMGGVARFSSTLTPG